MNTLSRAMTAQFFPDSAAYLALRRHWSPLVNSDRRHELTSAHHVLYLALLGKDWRRGFTPITNPRKLENGAYYGWALFHALRWVHNSTATWLLAPFDGLVTPAMLEQVRQVLPRLSPYAYRPDAFVPGAFPFPAYTSFPAPLAALAEKEYAHG
jgi:hypothetical protein